MKRTSSLSKRLALLSVAVCACGSIAWDAVPQQSENSVTSLNYTQETDRTLLEIGVQNDPTFSVYTLSNPSRVVVEILDCDTNSKINPLTVRNGVIDTAALSVSKSNDYQTCRVIMSLEKDADYTVDSSTGRIVLAVNGTPTRGDAVLDSYIAKAKSSDEALAQAQSIIAREQAARQEAERNARAAADRANEAEQRANDALADAKAAEQRANQALADAKAAQTREQNAVDQLNLAKVDAQNKIAAANAEAMQARATAQALEKSAANSNSVSARELQAARDQLAKAEAKLANAQNELTQLDVARNEAIQRANTAEKRADQAYADATNANARAVAAEKRADQAYADATNANARAVAAEKRANEALADANAALIREQNAVAQLNSAKKDAQNKIAAANAETMQARATAQALEKSAANSNSVSARELQAAREQLANAEAKLAQAQNDMTKLDKARNEAIARANAAEKRADQAYAEATSANNRANAANDRATAADHRANAANDRATAAEKRASAAIAEADAAIAREQNAVAQLNAAQIDAQNRINAAVKDAENARAAERQLAQASASDRSKNDSELKRVREQLANAEKELTLAQNEMKSLNAAKAEAIEREQKAIAKLNDAQNDAQKRIAAAQIDAENARKAERELAKTADNNNTVNARELANAREQLANAERELAQAQNEMRQLNAAKSDALAREQQAIEQRDAANARANNADQAYANIYAQNESLRAQLADQESEMKRLENEVQKAGAARRQIKKLEEAALTDSEAIAKRDAQIEELQKQVKAGRTAQKQLKTLKEENEQLRADAAAAAVTHQAPIDTNVGTIQTESMQVATTAPLDLGIPNASLKDIKFYENGDNMQVVVKLSSPASKVETVDIGNQRSVLRISDASLPDNFNKKYDTSAFKKGVRFVDSTTNDGNIELIAQATSQTIDSVEQNGDTITWNIKAIQNSYESYAAPIDRRVGAMVSASDNDEDLATNYGKRKTLNDTPFAKRKITLDIRDGEVTDLLRLLSDEINVSIVVSPDVKGRVTLSLKSVPLDQALDIILRMNDLGMKYEGNIIWIAKAETFRAEEERALKAAEVREKLEPLEVRLVPVNYATADDLSSNISSLLSSRGSVNIDKRTNTLILKDVAANLDAAEILVNNLDTQTPQILIEARIVETQANFTKEIGVQWGGDGIASAATGNATGIVFPSTIGIAGGSTSDNNAGTSATPNFAVNLPASVGTGAGGAIGFTFGSVGGAINLNVRLSAMEEKGFLKIVSAPRIMTLDNIQASIESGTSIPISVVSAAGAQTVFYDAKLNLQVTPHVTRDGNVYLKIDISKNEPDFGNTGASGDPSIIRKEAHTELLIPDGDTTVIGGIYTRNASQSMSSVPFFGSIPFLGYLFRNTSETDNRTELLIFITPRIINRDASIAAAGPGSFIPPEEKESSSK